MKSSGQESSRCKGPEVQCAECADKAASVAGASEEEPAGYEMKAEGVDGTQSYQFSSVLSRV